MEDGNQFDHQGNPGVNRMQGWQQADGPAGRYNGDMGTTGKKRAIKSGLYRLGLHTTPKGVVDALAQQGVQVDEELVRQVRFEMLKETTGAKGVKGIRPVPSAAVRRCPKGFPER